MTHNDYEKEVLIIIPAYNERGNIEKLIRELRSPEIAKVADILVMNDASTDGTNHAINKDHVAVVTHVFCALQQEVTAMRSPHTAVKEQPLLATTRESPYTAMKTRCCPK